MKNRKNSIAIVAMCLFCVGLIMNCTHADQDLTPVTPPPTTSDKELISLKTTSPPVIDGVVDAIWANCTKLQFSTSVPEVTGDVFRGYVGNVIPSVTMRSYYDDNNIYFLAEWADPTQSLKRSPWYFNPTTQRWAQESGTFDFTSTSPYRPPFYEDKMAILWNIDNSVSNWNSSTCYKSCHTGLPASDGYSKHYTNFPSERIDMWHWKSVRGGVNAGNQIHDQYQDNSYPNGRKSDPGTDVYTNNKKTLAITGSSPAVNVDVPKYIIPDRTDYGWIYTSEISAGTAKEVMAVSATGELTLSDATTIDPNIGTDYKRVGLGVGAKAVPGIYLNDVGYTGNAGDISCRASYTGSGWILEFKRALKTDDTEMKDVDFTSLQDQYFGFAIFENAQIAHSIKTNLVLKFKK